MKNEKKDNIEDKEDKTMAQILLLISISIGEDHDDKNHENARRREYYMRQLEYIASIDQFPFRSWIGNIDTETNR